LRVSSLWGGVKKLIEDGAIGQPRAALVELSRFPYRQGSGGWRTTGERGQLDFGKSRFIFLIWPVGI